MLPNLPVRSPCQVSSIAVAMAGLVAIAQTAPVSAQTTGAPSSEAIVSGPERAAQDDIVVTGSRIARTGFTTPSPTTVLGSEQLQNAGVTNVGEVTLQIPQFQTSSTPQTSTLSSQNAGAAILNLRNLGTTRTLVLVNGRRFVPTTTNSTVDTNVIPSSLIDRVEVVTGGASAAYGSDAVAGVVNLVLKRNIEGVVGDAQFGMSTHGDNETYKGSIAGGARFAGGAGHITLAAEGERNKGLGFQSSRRWARDGYGILTIGGVRQIRPDFQLATASLGGLITSGPLKGTDFGPDGQPRPFEYGQVAGNFQFGGSGFQPSDYLQLSVPYDRYSLYGMLDYDFGGVNAFVEASHAYSIGRSDITAPFHLGNITIQPDNAYLPAELAAQVSAPFSFGRYSTDMGYTRSLNANETDRVVAGLNGEISEKWKWNAYGEYGHTYYKSLIPNDLIPARFARSVDAVDVGARPVCRVNANASTEDDDLACVPVNLFGQGSPSQAAIDYFTGTGEYRVSLDERIVAASVTGTLFEIGGRDVSLAAGAEYRTEEVQGVSDVLSQANGFQVGNPKRLAGKYNIKEAFGEILVPLLEDIPMFKSLELNGAARATDYSTSGTVVTWKAGVSWQIIDDVRLRGTRSHDIRAPNFDELFTDTLFRFTSVSDPFNANIIRNVNIITQGNRNLRPEVADTLALGIVFSPSFLPNFRASVDYFKIKLKGAIGQLGAQDTVDRCFNGNDALCGFIQRNAAGEITSVTSTQVNLARVTTKDLDFEAGYRVPLGGADASLDLRFLATYVDEFISDDGITAINRAGNVGTTGLPHWKYNASLSYTDGPLNITLQNRYVGGGAYDVTIPLGGINNNHISARSYINASVQYAVIDTPDRKVQLFVNVRNLLDTSPPISPTNFQTPNQTNAALYDSIGRQITGGVRFRF